MSDSVFHGDPQRVETATRALVNVSELKSIVCSRSSTVIHYTDGSGSMLEGTVSFDSVPAILSDRLIVVETDVDTAGVES